MLKALFIITMIILSPSHLSAKTENNQTEELFNKAWEHIRLYEFGQAEPIFRKLRQQKKIGSDKWIEATFGLAVALHHKTPPSAEYIKEAKKLYQLIVDKYPQHRCAPRALMNIAKIYEIRDYYKDKIDLSTARKYYEMIITKYPRNPIVSEAVLRLAQAYTISYDKKDIYKGIKILNDWLKAHPKDRLRGIMYLHLGDVYFLPLRDYRKCVEFYIKADELHSLEEGREGFVYWRIAWIADHKLNDKKIAIKYYKKMIVDVPAFGKGYRAQLALRRLGVKNIPVLKWRAKMVSEAKSNRLKDNILNKE